jgi:HPt (histidine-containing phosphotransfer) domain-containing protein
MSDAFCAGIADHIPAYLNRRDADVKALQRALAEDDFQGVQEIAHNLKGSGSSYGFSKITEIGDGMEVAAKLGNRKEVGEHLSELFNYLSTIKNNVRGSDGLTSL